MAEFGTKFVKKSHRIKLSFFAATFVALTSLALTGAVASTFRSDNNIYLSSLHHIDDDFYAVGETIKIDGTVNGDLLAIGSRATLRGEIGGSGNFLVGTLNHSGRVRGSLRAAGRYQDYNGFIGGSLIAAGEDITLGQGSLIEKDVNAYAKNVSIDGVIKGSVEAKGKRVRISGLIGGDLNIESDDITLIPPLIIKGNLTYTSETEDVLQIDAGITVVGDITWTDSKADEEDQGTPLASFTFRISSLLAAFLFGIIILKLFGSYVEEAVNQLRSNASVVVAAGMLGSIVVALGIVILVVSIVAAFVGLILVQGETAVLGVPVLVFSILMIPISSFAALSGGILFYAGKIIVGFFLGMLVLGRSGRSGKSLGGLPLLAGLTLLAVIFWLPYIGGILYLLLNLVGAGAIIMGIKNCRAKAAIASEPAGSPPPSDS